MKKYFICFTSLLAVFLVPMVSAEGPSASYNEGVLHTLLGLDHLIAMIAVGLLSSQIGGRAVWQVPLIFVLSLIAGGALGLTLGDGEWRQWFLSSSEIVIMLSDLILVLAIIWFPARQRSSYSFSLVGIFIIVFGFFHGFAHGGEIPIGAIALYYVLGFTTTSILMHLLGVGIGEFSRAFRQPRVARGVFAATLLGLSLPYQVDFWNSIMPDFILIIFGF